MRKRGTARRGLHELGRAGKAWQEGAWPETAPEVVPDMPMPVGKTVHIAEPDAGQVAKSAQLSPAEFSASSRRRVTASSSCNRSQTEHALTRMGFGIRPSRTMVPKRVTPTPTYSAAAVRLRQRGRHPGGRAQLYRGSRMHAAS